MAQLAKNNSFLAKFPSVFRQQNLFSQGNIIDSLGGVRGDEDFADVTLSCCGSGDGGGSGAPVHAHKLILASCSNYFRRILRNLDNAHAHPTIILGDVDHSTLEALVTYMYRGEVFVSEDRLPAFFAAAQGFDSIENEILDHALRSTTNFKARTDDTQGIQWHCDVV